MKVSGVIRERAILIDIVDPRTSPEESELRLQELDSLVKTYGGVSILRVVQRRSAPSYRTYVGEGKVEDVFNDLESNEGSLKDIDAIIVNNLLKPRQIYNLEEFCINYQIRKREEEIKMREEALEAGEPVSKDKLRFENPKKIKVWDRVDLILKIFDKHAQTAEAKLQIELASIKHMGPRIFGMGLELSRQAGGIGGVGIGETNIEIMKRHLQRRTKTIEEKMSHYSQVQKQHRETRRKRHQKTVSLVGYTNAGKSTLIKALTKKQDVYIADALFATLDSKAGELFLPSTRSTVILTDTIGFIQDLPPELIQAFKSTLAEIIEADLLLHVIDISDLNIHKKISIVEDILQDLGIADKPKIYVFNKTDLLGDNKEPIISKLSKQYTDFNPQAVSALDRQALSDLVTKIENAL
jgi:GTP-binding protein HflX